MAAKDRLEESEQYQATLMANLSEAVISTDKDFNIRTWNPAAEITIREAARDRLTNTLWTTSRRSVMASMDNYLSKDPNLGKLAS